MILAALKQMSTGSSLTGGQSCQKTGITATRIQDVSNGRRWIQSFSCSSFARVRGSASILRIQYLVDSFDRTGVGNGDRAISRCISRRSTLRRRSMESRFQIILSRMSSIEFEPLSLAIGKYVARCLCPGLDPLEPGSRRFDLSSRAEPSVRTFSNHKD